MLRQLRHHLPGGWCHITTRGLGRKTILCCERDHEHFIVCSAARSCCGLTLRELGVNAGMSVDAVSKTIARINRRMEVDQKLNKFYNSVLSKSDESEA